MIWGLKVLNVFIVERNLECELISNNFYKFPAKFKPIYSLIIKKGVERIFIVALSNKAFWVNELESSAREMINDLIVLLKKRLIHVHAL